MKTIVEDVISVLTERYKDGTREPYPIRVLMGGLERLSEGKAVLHYIYSEGYGEQVIFRCTGHGGPYAYSLAKFLCDPHVIQELPVEEAAKRIAFTISWVAEDVNSTVGGRPVICIIKDNDPETKLLPEEVIEEETKHAKNIKEKLPNIFFPQK